ncbi:MAG: hypothetical protein NTY41_14515 [Proteobacteria bacterium]|nr:hypothetical protein [Pseudomonadota bacterium]
MKQYDFFETPVNPYTLLVEMAEVEIHVRDTETMEQSGVRGIVARSLEKLPAGQGVKLNCYGRLGARISDPWFIHVLEEMDDASLATDHIKAQSMDMEQSLKSPEQFKKSRYRKDQEK